MTNTTPKRHYNKRSEDERIHELEAQVAKIKARLEARTARQQSEKHKESRIAKEIARVQRSLRRFGDFALTTGRQDLALSAQAFSAGLERSLHAIDSDTSRGRSRSSQSGRDDD